MNIFSKAFNRLSKKVTSKSLKNAHSLNTDLVEFSYHSACCEECAKYRGRIFSISGEDTRFPKLPESMLQTGRIHEGCRCSVSPFIYGVSTPMHCKPGEEVKYSNRAFVDDRTNEEKINYQKFIESHLR